MRLIKKKIEFLVSLGIIIKTRENATCINENSW